MYCEETCSGEERLIFQLKSTHLTVFTVSSSVHSTLPKRNVRCIESSKVVKISQVGLKGFNRFDAVGWCRVGLGKFCQVGQGSARCVECLVEVV